MTQQEKRSSWWPTPSPPPRTSPKPSFAHRSQPGYFNSQADYIGKEIGETIGWLDSGLEVSEEAA